MTSVPKLSSMLGFMFVSYSSEKFRRRTGAFFGGFSSLSLGVPRGEAMEMMPLALGDERYPPGVRGYGEILVTALLS